MESHRIDGIKYDFDSLSREELLGIRGHLLKQHENITDDIGCVEGYMFSQDNPQLVLGELATDASGATWERFIEFTKDV